MPMRCVHGLAFSSMMNFALQYLRVVCHFFWRSQTPQMSL